MQSVRCKNQTCGAGTARAKRGVSAMNGSLRRRLGKVGVAALLAAAMVAPSALTAAASPRAKARYSQGASAKEILVGSTMPLTGGAAVAGEQFRAGMLAAIQEVNAHGGINGRKIVPTILDDGFQPARSVANILRLTEQDKVFVIDTPVGSAEIPGSYPLVKQTGIPMFGPYLPPDPNLRSVFLLATPHVAQARVIMDWLATQKVKGKRVTRVAFLGQQNDYGEAVLHGMQQQAGVDKLKIVAVGYTQTNSTDISSAVLAVKAANPQAVVLATDNTQSILALQQAQQLGWHPLFVGDSSAANTGTPVVVQPAGSAAKGLYGALVAALPTGNSKALRVYRAAVNKIDPSATSSAYALQAYAQNLILFEILRRMGNDLTWANFIKTAQSLKHYDTGLLPPISFGNLPGGHTGSHGAAIAEWTGSAWKIVQNFRNPKNKR
ncbi:MAG TPA: ABC transporter substrate-binding protein [Acidimicrobiales bacterium]|nr:ABC transporter substrate-binding protein [Acidimicrobiales bacterium]